MGLLDKVRKTRTPGLKVKRMSVAEKQERLDEEIKKKLEAKKIQWKEMKQTRLQ